MLTLILTRCPSTQKEFENSALFLRLGLLSTLIRPENAALHGYENALKSGGIWKRQFAF